MKPPATVGVGVSLVFISSTVAWAPFEGVFQSVWRKSRQDNFHFYSPPLQLALSCLGQETSNDRQGSVHGVTLKIALDKTGGAADLAAGKSERFTCSESLDMVHRLRAASQAVLVGRGTVVADNPSLTIRRVPAERQPLRVVLDPSGSLLDEWRNYQLFTDGWKTILFRGEGELDTSMHDLPDSVTCVPVPLAGQGSDHKSLSLTAIVQELSSSFNVNHLMVEGGPATAHQFLEEKLIDRCLIVRAPISFHQPLDSGLTNDVLEQAGLQYLGTAPSGVDSIDYWSRPDLPWPTRELTEWP